MPVIPAAPPPSMMVLHEYVDQVTQVMAITTTLVAHQRSRRLNLNPYVDDVATKGNNDDSVFGSNHSTT